MRTLTRIVGKTYKSTIRQFGRPMFPAITKKGYCRIGLSRHNRKHSFSVHRLVLLAFVGKNNLECNHKDGNKQNNNLSNLEYVTSSENMLHAFRIGLKKPALSNLKKGRRAKAVACSQFTKEGVFIKRYDCIADAGREHKKDRSQIAKCCKREGLTCAGYIWRY